MALQRQIKEPQRGNFSRQSTQVPAVQLINMDAFERNRVSNPSTVFDVKFEYDKQPLLFNELTAGGGAAPH